MATVYLAVQESLGRQVVLKILSKFEHPEQSERFLAEGQIIAALNHRNVITIHDIGRAGDCHYIAMEYLEGGSLTDRIRQGMTPAAALDLLESIGGCLDALHRKGVVHRDVKPDNILFHADGTPKLTDFGIAKQCDDDQGLTLDGRTFGSPYYLSPEQARGDPLDGRSDIYGLGIVFHEMLTGRRPYAEASHVQTIVAHINQPIPALPPVLAAYQDLLERMIAKAPEDRFGTAGELVGYVRGLRRSQLELAATARRSRFERLAGAFATRVRDLPWKAKTALAVALVAGAAGATLLQTRSQPPGPVGPATATLDEPQAQHQVAVEVSSDSGSGVQVPALPVQTAISGQVPDSPSDEAAPPPQAAQPERIEQMASATESEPALAPVPSATGTGVTSTVEPPSSPETAVALAAESVAAAPASADVERWLVAAETALDAYRLTTPAEDSAYFYYRKAMAADPDNATARQGLVRIADRYYALARKRQGQGDRGAALRYVQRGLGVRDDHARLLRLREELNRTASSAAGGVPADAVAQDTAGAGRDDQGGSFGQRVRNFWQTLLR